MKAADTVCFPLPDVITWVTLVIPQVQQILKAQEDRVLIQEGHNLGAVHM